MAPLRLAIQGKHGNEGGEGFPTNEGDGGEVEPQVRRPHGGGEESEDELLAPREHARSESLRKDGLVSLQPVT